MQSLYSLGILLSLPQDTAFLAALLHVLSPAGVFLSAPYQEASFAAFSFAGYLAYAAALKQPVVAAAASTGAVPVRRSAFTVLAGALFGTATLFRSNGLLNGLLFALDFVHEGAGLLICWWTGRGDGTPGDRKTGKAPRKSETQGRSIASSIVTLLALGVGACLVGAGSALPQLFAYKRYCSAGTDGLGRRPWCDGMAPSIYSFVQRHYW